METTTNKKCLYKANAKYMGTTRNISQQETFGDHKKYKNVKIKLVQYIQGV